MAHGTARCYAHLTCANIVFVHCNRQGRKAPAAAAVATETAPEATRVPASPNVPEDPDADELADHEDRESLVHSVNDDDGPSEHDSIASESKGACARPWRPWPRTSARRARGARERPWEGCRRRRRWHLPRASKGSHRAAAIARWLGCWRLRRWLDGQQVGPLAHKALLLRLL